MMSHFQALNNIYMVQMSNLRMNNQQAPAPMMKQAKKPQLSSKNSCPKRSVELFLQCGHVVDLGCNLPLLSHDSYSAIH